MPSQEPPLPPGPDGLPLGPSSLPVGPSSLPAARFRPYVENVVGAEGIARISARGHRLVARDPAAFRARIRVLPLASSRVIEFSSTPHRGVNGPEQVALHNEKWVQFAVMNEGEVIGHEGGRTLAFGPGTVFMLPMWVQWHYVRGRTSRSTSLQVPAAMLDRAVVTAHRRLSGSGFVDTTMTRALGAMLTAVAEGGPQPGSDDAVALENTLIGMIDAIVLSELERDTDGSGGFYGQAIAIVERDLGLGDQLGAASVAEELGIDVDHLQRVLRAHGLSFRQVLVQRRLERVAKMLREQSQLSIEDASAAVGFAGPTQASRAFKASYGVTMSEYRTLARLR